jgi:hypothetical protein
MSTPKKHLFHIYKHTKVFTNITLSVNTFHINDMFSVNLNKCFNMKHYDILIVDDEQRYADMLAKRLGLRGLACKVCYDGRQPSIPSRKNPFPVVILDLAIARPIRHGGVDSDQAVPARNRGYYSDRSRDGQGSGAVHGPRSPFLYEQTIGYRSIVGHNGPDKEKTVMMKSPEAAYRRPYGPGLTATATSI